MDIDINSTNGVDFDSHLETVMNKTRLHVSLMVSCLFIVAVIGCTPNKVTYDINYRRIITKISEPRIGKILIINSSEMESPKKQDKNSKYYSINHQGLLKDFSDAIIQSNVAKKVVEEYVFNGSVVEYLADENNPKFDIIVKLNILETFVSINKNKSFIWTIAMSATIVGTIFVGFLNPVTYHGRAMVEVEAWHVGKQKRIFKQVFRGEGLSTGWDVDDSKMRHASSSVRKALNMAYAQSLTYLLSTLFRTKL